MTDAPQVQLPLEDVLQLIGRKELEILKLQQQVMGLRDANQRLQARVAELESTAAPRTATASP